MLRFDFTWFYFVTQQFSTKSGRFQELLKQFLFEIVCSPVLPWMMILVDAYIPVMDWHHQQRDVKHCQIEARWSGRSNCLVASDVSMILFSCFLPKLQRIIKSTSQSIRSQFWSKTVSAWKLLMWKLVMRVSVRLKRTWSCVGPRKNPKILSG